MGVAAPAWCWTMLCAVLSYSLSLTNFGRCWLNYVHWYPPVGLLNTTMVLSWYPPWCEHRLMFGRGGCSALPELRLVAVGLALGLQFIGVAIEDRVDLRHVERRHAGLELRVPFVALLLELGVDLRHLLPDVRRVGFDDSQSMRDDTCEPDRVLQRHVGVGRLVPGFPSRMSDR